MINANELRLGNKVYCFDCIIIVTLNTLNSIQDENNKEYYNPIPLTEEWLLKLGFEQEYKSEYTIKYGIPEYPEFEYVLHLAEKKEFLRWKGDIIKCNSIHNLQNIFFVLTGEELTCID